MQQLPLDDRGVYEASLINWKSNDAALPCVMTGYPVLRDCIKFPGADKTANRQDWNRFLVAVKRCPENSQLQDLFKFIEK